ncbi:hypothetical protein N4R57_19935 [Rhodobacteraceae bacterium D3-12]|nr:hypothetical protein N4R57_19935 [Rhodobacteraceae bacterium D3-12]
MSYLSHIQTVFEGALPNLGEAVALDVDPLSGDLLIHDAANQSMVRIELDDAAISQSDISIEDRAQSNDTVSIDFKGTERSLDSAIIDGLAQNSGEGEGFFDASTFYGNMVTMASLQVGSSDYLYLARKSGFGLEVYRLEESGSLTPVQIVADTEASHLKTVSAMTAFENDGQSWLVTASSGEDGISLFAIDTDGEITLQSSFGFDQQLPVTTPTALTSVTIAGHTYVLLSAFGTSSLTVMEAVDGQLEFRDQINDSLETRFAGACEIAAFTSGDLALVAVAGNDGGVTVMQVLPSGHLLHRETITDQAGTALGTVDSLQFVETSDGAVDLFVLSAGDGGMSRFRLDDNALGVSSTGGSGTSGNDVLSAGANGSHLQGGSGSDVLVDGAGQDTFSGGDGADSFILIPDGEPDTINDFDPSEDRLDFSGFDMVHDITALHYQSLWNGAALSFGEDSLTILSESGRSLSLAELAQSLDGAADHVLMPEPLPQTGSDSNDTFEASVHADTVNGGGGFDTLTYHFAANQAVVNLSNSALNDGAAAGHVLNSIEGVIGSAFGDLLIGNSGANLLIGAEGDDTIFGGDGSDWITPGNGSNVVDGGAGWDMASFVDLYDTPGRTNLDYRLNIDLASDQAVNHTGSEATVLTDIERITGTIYADRIRGDDADNELRGLGDYDWFIATPGSDSYDGGTGRDMISYVEATSGITVDLSAQQGTQGLAAGDSFISVERVTGSSHADTFYGDDGENDFRGMGGYDVFVGSEGGRERYDGGSGVDTVAYFQSTEGVEASLLRGYGSQGDAARDLYTSIENLGGTSFDDILAGDHERNQLRGLAGDDLLIGNGGVDYITGGLGNDLIDGGSGSDYAVFSGDFDEYEVTRVDDTVQVTGPDGIDTLTDVEYFLFDDAMRNIWSL